MTPDSSPAPGAALPAGYRMAELAAGDRDLLIDLATWAFASTKREQDEERRTFALEPGRMVGVWAPDPRGAVTGADAAEAPETLAAAHASYAFTSFGVPGGTLPTAGLTWVAVHPQHRRRGLARAMVTAHLHRTAARGEALSVLFASEPSIYGRYGYGRASHHVTLTLQRGQQLRPVPGADKLTVRAETADRARHAPIVRAVHDACERPGWARRGSPGLEDGVFAADPDDGGEPLRIASVQDQAGATRAYALFSRRLPHTGDWVANGTVSVREAVALDGAAARALWGFLTDLDLMGSVKSSMLAPDDPLLAQLVNTRLAKPVTVDNVWARLVDLPAALRGRTYAAPVDVVLDVTDELLAANAGRWRLRAASGSADLEPTSADPDLVLDTAELATAYLGGVSLASLGAAGLVREVTPGALAACSTALGWPQAPVTSWIF